MGKKGIMQRAALTSLAVLIVLAGYGNKTAETANNAISEKVDGVVTTTADDDYTPQRDGYTFSTEVRTINEEGDVRWDSIIVHLTDAKGHTQELYCQSQPLDTVNWEKGSIGEILEDDWNFDGIPDLQVCTGPMNGFGNFTYAVWLWDDKAHQFKELDMDFEIFDPSIDTENKCIVSVWRLDDEVEIVRYKWKEGHLIEAEREQMSYSDLVGD